MNYWAGATDKRHEGLWLWETDQEIVQDFIWFISEYSMKNKKIFDYIINS